MTGLDVIFFFLIENIMVRTLLLIVVGPNRLVCSLLKGSCVRGYWSGLICEVVL